MKEKKDFTIYAFMFIFILFCIIFVIFGIMIYELEKDVIELECQVGLYGCSYKKPSTLEWYFTKLEDLNIINWKKECIEIKQKPEIELINTRNKCDWYCDDLYKNCENISENLNCEFKIEDIECYKFCRENIEKNHFFYITNKTICKKYIIIEGEE